MLLWGHMPNTKVKKDMNRIAYFTSARFRYGTQIFIKQCRSLANHEYDIALFVEADDKDDQCKEGAVS